MAHVLDKLSKQLEIENSVETHVIIIESTNMVMNEAPSVPP